MFHSSFWRRLVIAVSFMLLMTLSLPLTMLPRTAFADNINPGVLAIDATLGGLTYGQWSEKWWQWAFSVTTFDDCTVNQSGPMWFLAGTTDGTIANRNCTVPPQTNIMFPTFNVEWSVEEAKAQEAHTGGTTSCPLPDINGNTITGEDYASLSACAIAFAQHATAPHARLTAQVDGVKLKQLTNYRALSPAPPFTFTAVEGNPFGLHAGPSQAVADGFWIILGPQPLSAGKHTIDFAATVPFPELGFTFTTGANYCLIVQPSSQTCP